VAFGAGIADRTGGDGQSDPLKQGKVHAKETGELLVLPEEGVIVLVKADIAPLQFLLDEGMTVEPIGGVEGKQGCYADDDRPEHLVPNIEVVMGEATGLMRHLSGPGQPAQVAVDDNAVEAVIYQNEQAAKQLCESLHRSSPSVLVSTTSSSDRRPMVSQFQIGLASIPSDRYPMKRLSGDRKGTQYSAAVRSRDSPDSREWTHIRPFTRKTSLRPSGDT
jgi:hypothetical protein